MTKKISHEELVRRRNWLRDENAKWPEEPVRIPPEDWPVDQASDRNLVAIWRNRDYVVHVFLVSRGLVRLAIFRMFLTQDGDWDDRISWDDLQKLKNACGFSDKDAVEVFPRQGDQVRGANGRYLWILDEPLSFAWRACDAVTAENTQPNETQNESSPATRRF